MKILKYFFFLLLIVIIGGAIYFATQDGSFDVAVNKTINAAPQVVYNNVKDFKNWQAWGPWVEEDPDIQIAYAEKTAGEGASYSWKSDKMGDGGMKTIKVIPNKEIDQTISFNTPMGDSESEVYWRFKGTETPGQTQVTWGMKGERSLVEKVFMSFQKEDFEMQLRVMYAKGLDNLKATVENEIKKYSVNVDGVSQHGGGFYMYVTAASRMDGIATKMGGMFGQVSGYMAQNNIDATGMPFTIYNTIDAANNTVIFSTAIPVRERVIIPEGSPVVCGFMEPPVAVKVTLKGNYNNLDKAYAAGMQYVAENNLEVGPTAKMFEVYRNDPGEVPNPAHWLTEVYIPIIPNTPTQQ